MYKFSVGDEGTRQDYYTSEPDSSQSDVYAEATGFKNPRIYANFGLKSQTVFHALSPEHSTCPVDHITWYLLKALNSRNRSGRMLYFVRKANQIWEKMIYDGWWMHWDLLSDKSIASIPAVDVEYEEEEHREYGSSGSGNSDASVRKLSKLRMGGHRYRNVAYEN